MTVRIAHISDTHLGTRPRRGVKHNIWAVEMRIRLLENDFYERFAELFDRISELDPPADIVIHSGQYNQSQKPKSYDVVGKIESRIICYNDVRRGAD